MTEQLKNNRGAEGDVGSYCYGYAVLFRVMKNFLELNKFSGIK